MARAAEARRRAYAPYSGYRVGAAIRAEDGRVFAAANVENGIPALSICAERNAIARAVAEGATRFVALAVVTASSPPAYPCGLCRQTLAEFVDDLPILVANTVGEEHHTTLGELLPHPFRLDRQRVTAEG
jgi:cytidine deaminase